MHIDSVGLCLLSVITLEVEHQQLPAGVLVGPVAEGQHGFLQQVGGIDLLSVIVVELTELPSDALFYSKPLSSRVAVEQKHLQKPAETKSLLKNDNIAPFLFIWARKNAEEWGAWLLCHVILFLLGV